MYVLHLRNYSSIIAPASFPHNIFQDVQESTEIFQLLVTQNVTILFRNVSIESKISLFAEECFSTSHTYTRNSTLQSHGMANVTNSVFFSTKKCAFFLKNAILCLFLKNVLPSKRVVCFILNNLHFPMVKGIAFYAPNKSRVLIIPCKADDFCLFVGLPDEI